MVPHLEWPGAAQVARIERTREIGGKASTETAYIVTSLTVAEAGPERLLELSRGHWAIENRLHYVRDETLGEDRCQIHRGSAPQVLAALRNGILSLLRYHGWSNIAEANRRYAATPQKALQLLGGFTT